jgi:hypothetical protein
VYGGCRNRKEIAVRKLLPLLVLAIVPLVLASAAGARSDAAGRSLVVRPNGPAGPLLLLDLASLRVERRLPPGMTSADGGSFLAARIEGTHTALTRYALPSGRVAGRSVVQGRYALAAVAAGGARAVLAASRPGAGVARLAIVEAPRWRVARRVSLRGSYGVEAVSADGRRLFLIRYGAAGYNLRIYDFATGQLRPTALAEGASATRKMVGTAWRSLTTRDGRWLLTLYVKRQGGAFVHALDLDAAIGHCVELPADGAGLAVLASASLALSPDDRRLYVATPSLGRVLELAVVPPRVAREVRFPDVPGAARGDGVATVSPGGRTVAFTAGGQLWRYDVAAGAALAPVRIGGTVVGLGFTPDAARIVAVHATGGTTVVDAVTGQTLS